MHPLWCDVHHFSPAHSECPLSMLLSAALWLFTNMKGPHYCHWLEIKAPWLKLACWACWACPLIHCLLKKTHTTQKSPVVNSDAIYKYQLFLLSSWLLYFTPILSDCLETPTNMVNARQQFKKLLGGQTVNAVKYEKFVMKLTEFGLWRNTKTVRNIHPSFADSARSQGSCCVQKI